MSSRRAALPTWLIAVVDGLKGFPEAIEAVFPEATVQTCIVHLIRRSLAYASYKERRALAGALKTIYRAPTQAPAEEALRNLSTTLRHRRLGFTEQAVGS